MANVSVFCFLASYLVAFGLECVRLLRRTAYLRLAVWVAGLAGLVAHTFYLMNQSRQTGLPPLLSSPHDWFLVLAWLSIVLYLFLSLVDRELPLGLFLLPLVLFLIASSYFVSADASPVVMPAPDEAHRVAIRSWGMLHASLLVFGIGCVLVGFVLSLMYLVQHRRLKHKHAMQGGLTLPSLERLARMIWWAIGTAVPLLLFGMITGIGLWYAKPRDASASSLFDPVVIGNGVVWFAMMAFFGWLKLTQRPAAKQVAWLTLWAFGLLLATLVGLEVLSPGHFSSKQADRTFGESKEAQTSRPSPARLSSTLRLGSTELTEVRPEGSLSKSCLFLKGRGICRDVVGRVNEERRWS